MPPSSSAASTAGTARAPLVGAGAQARAVGRRPRRARRAARAARPRRRRVRRVQLDLHRVAAQLALELVGRALDHDPPVVDDRQPVGEAVGLVEVVGGEQHGDALVGRQAPDLGPHRRRAPRGPARWSARPGTARAGGASARSRRRACAPSRPRSVLASRSAASPSSKRVQQLLRARARAARDMPWISPGQHEVLPRGGHRVARRLLRRRGRSRARTRSGSREHVDARHGRPARVGARERGEDLHGGRLAGAVGAEQREHAAGGDLDGQAVERADVAVGLDEVGGVQRRL